MSRRSLDPGQAARVGAHRAPRAGAAAASAIAVRPAETSPGVRTPPNAALMKKEPQAICAAKAPSMVASIFSCTMRRASRVLSDCRPPGASRLWVRAAIVNTASAPACALALAMASDRLVRRRETIQNPCPADVRPYHPNTRPPGSTPCGKLGAAASLPPCVSPEDLCDTE